MERLLTLAQLAKNAGLSPATAIRYLRLCEPVLPGMATPRATGRERRYPAAAAALLARVSALYRAGSTSAEIAGLLAREAASAAAHTPAADPTPPPEPQTATAPEPMSGPASRHAPESAPETPPRPLPPEVASALARLESLDGLRAEVDTLRQTVTLLWDGYQGLAGLPGRCKRLHEEADRLRASQLEAGTRMSRLEGENERLREALRESRARLDEAAREAARHAALLKRLGPDEEFLDLPLVFRSERGEFLGVADTGRRRSFSLGDFVRTIKERAADPDRGADASRPRRALFLNWTPRGAGHWTLTIRERAARRPERRHVVEFDQATTPQGNAVALLRRLSVNGRDLPVLLFYELFKQLGRQFA